VIFRLLYFACTKQTREKTIKIAEERQQHTKGKKKED